MSFLKVKNKKEFQHLAARIRLQAESELDLTKRLHMNMTQGQV